MREAVLEAFDLDATLLDPASSPVESVELNNDIVDRLGSLPDFWSFPIEKVRSLRLEGRGPFPLCDEDLNAIHIDIPGPAGRIPARLYRPVSRQDCGVYLHFHGGGWCLGSARENDGRSRRLAETTGLAVLSVDYRLAPENPYPAGPDDCEHAAMWLLSDDAAFLCRDRLAIGGESAGAHLAVVTLIRLRDRHDVRPFMAASLNAGCYDLSGTASVREWGDEKLVLNTRDVEMFFQKFLPHGTDVSDPDISPVQGDLTGLPHALLTCGTRDLLLDDTLLMARKWRDDGNHAELSIWPGGCHVFQAFPTEQANQSLTEMANFLKRATGIPDE